MIKLCNGVNNITSQLYTFVKRLLAKLHAAPLPDVYIRELARVHKVPQIRFWITKHLVIRLEVLFAINTHIL